MLYTLISSLSLRSKIFQKIINSSSFKTLKNESEIRKNKKDRSMRAWCLVSSQQYTSGQQFIGFSQQWSLLLLDGLHCDCSCIPLVVSDMLFNKAHIISPSKWWGFSICAGLWVFLNWFSSSRKPWSPERMVKGICLGSCSSRRPA